VKRIVLATAAVLAAVFFFLLATLPPRPASIPLDSVDRELKSRTVSGAYHIHTTRSDGAGSKAEVAAAAARAGLKFAIFTDHGDGTQPADAPAYLSGVLCLDAVEISTNGGHYVALAARPSPYPLGGEASTVVEDVRRLDGLGIVAHPDHPGDALAWSDWDVPFDGIEWLNADAEWRDEGPVRIARALFDYFLRPAPALASVFDRPIMTLERWDTLEKRRPVIALAAVDAHGRARARIEGTPAFGIGPSYEASFRSLSNRVLVERPLTGDAAQDAQLLIAAIKAGRVYSVVDAISPDVILALSADRGFEPASTLPDGAQPFTFTRENRRRLEVHAAAAPGTPEVPWVVSNWAGPREPALPGEQTPAPAEVVPLRIASEWRVEKDAASSARISAAGDVVALEYKLRADGRVSQFAAAGADLQDAAGMTGILFRGRATKPMRVSVQLRFSPNGARWTKSVYLEPAEQEIRVNVPAMVPAERTDRTMPDLSNARSILFVVDLVNARPGDNGAFTISALRGVR
jgi:hypothetical protein